jgi:hypothetical protein
LTRERAIECGFRLITDIGCRRHDRRRRSLLFDPIFQGLAISLMAGEVASLLLSRMAVPILYYMAKRHECTEPVTTARPLAPWHHDALPAFDAGHSGS